MATTRVSQAMHLAKRFFGSLDPSPPPETDESWARSHLLDGEARIWATLSNPDRRHAVAVARGVEAELGDRATRPVLAAALLHDSGKVISGLGTFARVGATVFWAVADRSRAEVWAERPAGLRHRLGTYRRHPELGADELARVGADPLTVAWAREHHRPMEAWTVPVDIGLVLKSCDDD